MCGAEMVLTLPSPRSMKTTGRSLRNGPRSQSVKSRGSTASHGVADGWIHRNAGHHETIEEGSDLVHDATGTRTFVKGWSMGPRL